MNADDRGPAGEAKPPFAPVSGEAPLRREAIRPSTTSVPQRTAFRSVTGTQPTTPRASAQASATGAPRAAAPQAAGTPGNPYSPGAARPQSAGPPSAGAPTTGAPAAFAPTTGGPTASAPTTGFPATGVSAAGTAGTVASAAGAEAARSTANASGIGRLRGVVAEKSKGNNSLTPIPGAPRKVRVLLSRIDPWSALKIGFLIAIAIGIMTVVAVHILWMTLNQMETFVTIQEWVSKLFTQEQEVNILQFFSYSKIMSATLLVSVVNVVLISGLSVITAFVYNMISRVVGGVYVTLTDD